MDKELLKARTEAARVDWVNRTVRHFLGRDATEEEKQNTAKHAFGHAYLAGYEHGWDDAQAVARKDRKRASHE